ncbi:membrane bound O-acyl transferase family-domain-containing protein [Tricladium varicosporioides]|nr:membrane bound O-acyl transferase family-domain-containing protein [Hymenoscyphus varicosporioides]
MFFDFVPDTARPLAPRPYLIPSIYIVCILGPLLPRSKARSVGVTLAILYLCFQIPKYTYGEKIQDYMFPIQALQAIIGWLDMYIIHSPDEFHLNGEKIKVDEKVKKGWWKKLKESWLMNTTNRGVGWNWEVKNVPKAAPVGTSRWLFARTEFTKAFIFYLIFDIIWTIMSHTPYASSNPPDLFSGPLLKSILFAWLPAIGSYYTLNMQYSLFASQTVLYGMYTPQDWPPLMGKLRDVKTVRGFWGSFWHQMLRRKLNIPYNLFTKAFPIQKGSFSSRYTQLFFAFAASAFIHHVGAWNITGSSARNNMIQAFYFLSQPCAIMAEDLAIYLGKKVGIKESWKTNVLGKVWTFAWFSFALIPGAAFQYNAGFLGNPAMPSLCQAILRFSGFGGGLVVKAKL